MPPGGAIMTQILESPQQNGPASAVAKAEPVVSANAAPGDATGQGQDGGWGASMAIHVYGHGLGTHPFSEQTVALAVYRGGALLVLSVPVREQQRLVLTQCANSSHQECRIVRVSPRDDRKFEVDVEFAPPNPEFFQIRNKQDRPENAGSRDAKS